MDCEKPYLPTSWSQLTDSHFREYTKIPENAYLTNAQEMYQRAWKELGPDHISTFNAMNNLGILYADQDSSGEAEYMYQRALEGYEKALELGHTSTLHTINNLGLVYANQGSLQEAEGMYRRALEGHEKVLRRGDI
jgi:tetratricopeptide (TPR) repeat protein